MKGYVETPDGLMPLRTPRDQPYICPYCEGTYRKADEFCPECGEKVRAPLIIRALFVIGTAIVWAVLAVIVIMSALPNLAVWLVIALIAGPYLAFLALGRFVRRVRKRES